MEIFKMFNKEFFSSGGSRRYLRINIHLTVNSTPPPAL